MSHPCAIPSCTTVIRPGLLMCPPDWRRVPAELQAEVNRTWKAYDAMLKAVIASARPGPPENAGPSPDERWRVRSEYLAARDKAIAAVVEQLADA